MTAATKEELRIALRDRRNRVPPALALEAADEASREAAASELFAGARRVAAYVAIRGELSPAPLLQRLRERGIEVVYPRVVAGDLCLEFCVVNHAEEFVPGVLGIPEPGPSTRQVPLADIDTFLIPGLGFDRRGNRIGWGRGYYDATVCLSRHARLVGYGFTFQLVDHIPSSSHDLTLHDIITEHGVISTQRYAAP